MAETKQQDAIALLKQDHREVEELFEEFEKASGDGRKQKLAEQICLELSVHAQIEEEIFYPACEGNVDEDLLKEAYVEHDGGQAADRRDRRRAATERRISSTPRSRCCRKKSSTMSRRKRSAWTACSPRRARRGLDMDALGEQLAARKARTDRAVQGERHSRRRSSRRWTKSRSE